MGPKNLFKTLWLNFLSQIAIYSFTIISQIKETRQSDKPPVERIETHNGGRLKLDTWRLSFTYIKNQKHSRMKIFAKITSRQMGSWSRTFLTYHDFCTGLRERIVLNYFAGCRPCQQLLSKTFIVLQKFAAVIMIVHWQTAMSALDNKSWKGFKKSFLCV